MSKRLKYYDEIQTKRGEMERVLKGNGTLEISPTEAVVGSSVTIRLTYTVGEYPIYPGGVIRFTVPFGYTKPQVDLPVAPGYVTASTTSAGTRVTPMIKKTEWWKRGEDRTKLENVSQHTGLHIWVKVSGSALMKGSQVTLLYGDTSFSDGASVSVCKVIGHIQFDVATDPRGWLEAPFSGFYLSDSSPKMELISKEAKAFELIIPSEIEPGRAFGASVFARDTFHNPVFSYEGEFTCIVKYEKMSSHSTSYPEGSGESIVYQGSFSPGDCGIANFPVCLREEGIVTLMVFDSSGTIRGQSNPAVCKKNVSQRHFWGDMHGHTAIQWGRGSGRAYYEFAREIAALDFCSLTDPDAGRYTNNNETARFSAGCYMTDEKWELIKAINREFYEEGKFVPILGYEYHNDAPDAPFGGDRNVYFSSYEEPIRRCVDSGSYCPAELWETFEKEGVKAITIPHHTAKKEMPGSWDLHNETYNRLVELYSSWGSSECEGCEYPIIGGSLYDGHSVRYALEKGYRLGFVGGSDTHAGTPGYCFWVFAETFNSYRGGLTCVMADKLDQENIFHALWNRNVYVTTGERIILEFFANDISMGQELPLKDNPVRHLEIRVIGTDQIDKVEVISRSGVIYMKHGEGRRLDVSFTDDGDCPDGWTYYYVKVLQKNKAATWSSPIWFS